VRGHAACPHFEDFTTLPKDLKFLSGVSPNGLVLSKFCRTD
jgi:hypothetical protein